MRRVYWGKVNAEGTGRGGGNHDVEPLVQDGTLFLRTSWSVLNSPGPATEKKHPSKLWLGYCCPCTDKPRGVYRASQ